MAAAKGISFESIIPYARKKFRDKDTIDILSKLLIIDHKERILSEEALHPFFALVRDADTTAHGLE
jgi:serine/threonine protein kinase